MSSNFKPKYYSEQLSENTFKVFFNKDSVLKDYILHFKFVPKENDKNLYEIVITNNIDNEVWTSFGTYNNRAQKQMQVEKIMETILFVNKMIFKLKERK